MGVWNKEVKQFTPHDFNTKYKIMIGDGEMPILYIEPKALEKMRHLVNIATEEVGWLGTCYRDGWMFTLKDIFLIGQNVSAVHTTLDEDGLAAFCNEILKQENGEEIYNNLRFWGHSHANMGTGPSAQDDTQMGLFEHADVPWMIRGILNKKGVISLTLYLYESKIKVEDMAWNIVINVSDKIGEEIKKEYNEKVKTRCGTRYDQPGYVHNPSEIGYHSRDLLPHQQHVLPGVAHEAEYSSIDSLVDDIDENGESNAVHENLKKKRRKAKKRHKKR